MITWHRRARKTTLTVNKLVLEACQSPKRVFAYIAPTYKQAKSIVWRDPRMLKQYCPREVLKKDPNETELYCQFFNDAILQVLGADDPDSIRGKDFAGVVLDEFALMKPEIWTEILRPVLAANGGWAWFTFTPKGRNHAYKLWRDSESWPDWSRHFLSAETSGIIPLEELEQARREMSEALYRQEFLCEFLEGEGTVFRRVTDCVFGDFRDPEEGHQYIVGCDVARTHDFTVIFVLDVTVRPVHVVHFQRFNQIDWGFQKEKIRSVCKKYNDAFLWLDSTGVGDGIEHDLRKAGVRVWGYKFTNQTKKELVEFAVIAIEQKLVTYPHIEQFIKETQDFTYELLPGGSIRYGAPEGESYFDDCVIAFGLALQGAKQIIYNPEKKKEEDRLKDLPLKDQAFWQRWNDERAQEKRRTGIPGLLEDLAI